MKTVNIRSKSNQQILTELFNYLFARIDISESMEEKISTLVNQFKIFCMQTDRHKQLLDGTFYEKFSRKYNNREVVEIFVDTDQEYKNFNLNNKDTALLGVAKNFLYDPETASLNRQIGSYLADILESNIFNDFANDIKNWKLKFVFYPPQTGSLRALDWLKAGYSVVLHQSSMDFQIFNRDRKWGPVKYGSLQVVFLPGMKIQYLSDGAICAPHFMVPESKDSIENGRVCIQLENTFQSKWRMKEIPAMTLPAGHHYDWDRSVIQKKLLI